MRAEVAAADGRSRAMTRYARGVAAVEAAGAGLTALLPIGPHGRLPGAVLAALAIAYSTCLLPTLAVARRARVQRTSRDSGRQVAVAARTCRLAPAAPDATAGPGHPGHRFVS